MNWVRNWEQACTGGPWKGSGRGACYRAGAADARGLLPLAGKEDMQ